MNAEVDADEETQLLDSSGRRRLWIQGEILREYTGDKQDVRVETNTINTITSTNASTLLNLHDGSIRRDRNPIYLSLIVSTLCFVLVAITFIDRKDYSRSFGFTDKRIYPFSQ